MSPVIHKLAAGSRFLILLAVVGCFAVATTLLCYGLENTREMVLQAVQGYFAGVGSKKLQLKCIELVDIFLLATVFYITALGLYELFIDDTIPVPAWLEVHSLDDLKEKLIGVVVTVLAVLFLGQIVTWDGERDLLGYGVAIGAVIVALTFYSRKSKDKAKGPSAK
jgi:uncharacterized membrane protein YqhA